MPSLVNIGGSANVNIDLSSGNAWELTGLDANGNLLPEVNVNFVNGATASSQLIFLPSLKSINYRIVNFNLFINDYTYDLQIQASFPDLISGQGSINLPSAPSETCIPISSKGKTWFAPVSLT